MRIWGFSWINSEAERVLRTESLVSKVLCKRHNEALSSLDSVAGRLFRTFDKPFRDPEALIEERFKIFATTGTCKEGPLELGRIFLFNGHDIERWALKTLCCLLSSGAVVPDTGPLPGWKPPIHWLRILFGEAAIPQLWGLYHLGEIGQANPVRREFKSAIICSPSVGPYGLMFNIHERNFVLALLPKPPIPSTLSNAIHRPTGYLIKTPGFTSSVVICWDTPVVGSSIVIDYSAQTEIGGREFGH